MVCAGVPMKLELADNEHLIKQGLANMMRGPEAVGGKLFLTNHRLAFNSHAINFQTGLSEYTLSEVSGAQPVWTKVFGFVPLVPNGLAVTLADGSVARFVVYGRRAWVEAIGAQLAQRPAHW